MLPQKKPGQDDQPQVKRRFVGICLSLQSKGKHVPVFYGLVCNLEEAGLIRSKTVFKYYCDFAGMGQKIQVGTYTLRRDMTMAEIAEQLTAGDGNPLVRNHPSL